MIGEDDSYYGKKCSFSYFLNLGVYFLLYTCFNLHEYRSKTISSIIIVSIMIVIWCVDVVLADVITSIVIIVDVCIIERGSCKESINFDSFISSTKNWFQIR